MRAQRTARPAHGPRRRKFRLGKMDMEAIAEKDKALRARNERNLEEFMDDIEEDPDLRAHITLYKGAIAALYPPSLTG